MKEKTNELIRVRREVVERLARRWLFVYYDTRFYCWLVNRWGGYESRLVKYAAAAAIRDLEQAIGTVAMDRVFNEFRSPFIKRVGFEQWHRFARGKTPQMPDDLHDEF